MSNFMDILKTYMFNFINNLSYYVVIFLLVLSGVILAICWGISKLFFNLFLSRFFNTNDVADSIFKNIVKIIFIYEVFKSWYKLVSTNNSYYSAFKQVLNELDKTTTNQQN